MIIAGLCGGLDRAGENRFGVTPYAFHDAACALLVDGDVRVAIEEERLSRVKHTNKMPLSALRFCLDTAGLTLADVDAFAFGVRESYLDEILASRYAHARSAGLQGGRQALQQIFEEAFGLRPDPRRFHFVDHHVAHACSAFHPSGFDTALVFTTDAVGDGISGAVYVGNGHGLQVLHEFPEEDSLGFFYVHVTRYLGLDLFDEYKVMGLAPYGDGRRFAPIFDELYTLLPDGTYHFDRERMRQLWQRLPPRSPGADYTQADRDVAMAAQLTLQRIVRHVVEHFQRLTGLDRLCLAGGVALNCTMNGDLLRHGPFRHIFVQPAAHDAGLAIGAASCVQQRLQPSVAPRPALRHVYWGGHGGSAEEIDALLGRWDPWIDSVRLSDPYAAGARLLSEGTVLGWVRGRSEFGPRALGNRSILADPRPAENKDIINALIKKREAFRPFAPSVLEEYAAEYFELPDHETRFPFMLFTMPVRPRHRALLGAVTHVDGSARIQTVSKDDNPCYWQLIDAFRARTGVPVLLNTSFNNHAEPIVETAADALVCLLTTNLHALVLDGWLVRRKARTPDALLPLTMRLPISTKLHPAAEAAAATPHDGPDRRWWRRLRSRLGPPRAPEPAPAARPTIGTTHDAREQAVPDAVWSMLLACDGCQTIDALMARAGVSDEMTRRTCLESIDALWERRLVVLAP